MSRELHYHPLSSYCHKVLIALYELDIAFTPRLLNLGDAAERAAFLALWPTGKMPVLVDDGRVIAESSILIEHLDRGRAQLLPADADAALAVRLWDRLSDLYLMTPQQSVIANMLRPAEQRDPLALANAERTLAMAYGLFERRLQEQGPWLGGAQFSLADCAATPALFYARTLLPLQGEALNAYFERLLLRPSVARVLEEAKPFFRYFPMQDRLEPRFLTA